MVNKKSLWGKAYMESGRRGDPFLKHARFYTLENVAGLMKEADYRLDTIIAILNDPPNVVPHGEPRLWFLPTRKASNFGVFLTKGTKIEQIDR
jgi:hypothetical protein